MGWGGACVTVPRKENTRTSRHVKRYGDGDGVGDREGVGWGTCYRSMEGQHKDKQTCVTVAWKDNTRTSRHEKRYGDGDGDGAGWGMCYRSMEGEHKDKQT